VDVYQRYVFETTTAQDSRGVGCLIKLVRPVEKSVRVVWLSQLAQDFKKESIINQIKIQLLKLGLCLIQVMGSVLWLKEEKEGANKG
jgi:hypothetical protein